MVWGVLCSVVGHRYTKVHDPVLDTDFAVCKRCGVAHMVVTKAEIEESFRKGVRYAG